MAYDDEAEAVLAALCGVPQIGDTFSWAFTYRGGYQGEPTRWRVDAYLKRYTPPPLEPEVAEFFESVGMAFEPTARLAGPDNVPLIFCRREEAEYVSATATCGIIVRVSEVHVDGRVDWPDDLMDDARRDAEQLVGKVVR